MNRDEESWKKQLEKFTVVKRCPKCGSLRLTFDYNQNSLRCLKCGYEQKFGRISE